MTDWNKIAESMQAVFEETRWPGLHDAIALCRRMAEGELVERSAIERILDDETIQGGMDYHHALQELIGE